MNAPAEKPQISLSNVFSTIFSGNLEGLMWTETSRSKPWQFYGRNTIEELPEELRKGIPEGIDDAFVYKLETPYVTAFFSQLYMPYHTLATQQYLVFQFGRPSQSLAQMLDANPWAPENAQVTMEFGKYSDTEGDYIHLRQNGVNLMTTRKIFSSEGGRGDAFTHSGDAMMQDLLAQKDKMTSVPGLNDADRELLRATLGILETQYKAGDIGLIGWFD